MSRMDRIYNIPDIYRDDGVGGIIEGLKRQAVYEMYNLSMKRRDTSRFFRKLKKDIMREGAGTDINEIEWENCIILDAMRYDQFEEFSDIEGDLSRIESVGSCSREFIEYTFNRDMSDTVLVTCNPNYRKVGVLGNFHDHYDYSLISPAEMKEKTMLASYNHPDKRIVSHFMNPHVPHISTGEETPNRDVEKGKIPMPRVIDGYRGDIEIVLPHVKYLLDALGGRSIVTSDHGEGFGEGGVYGHPCYTRHKYIVEVPLLVV